jgi:hypothetical protein
VTPRRSAALPSSQSHLKSPSALQIKEAIVKELATQGRGNFRNVMDILVKTNDLIQKSIDVRNAWLAELGEENAPPIKEFSVKTIQEAARKSKRRAAPTDTLPPPDPEAPADETPGAPDASGAS